MKTSNKILSIAGITFILLLFVLVLGLRIYLNKSGETPQQINTNSQSTERYHQDPKMSPDLNAGRDITIVNSTLL